MTNLWIVQEKPDLGNIFLILKIMGNYLLELLIFDLLDYKSGNFIPFNLNNTKYYPRMFADSLSSSDR